MAVQSHLSITPNKSDGEIELKGYTSSSNKQKSPIAFNEMEGIDNLVSTVQNNIVSSPRNKSGGDNLRKKRLNTVITVV